MQTKRRDDKDTGITEIYIWFDGGDKPQWHSSYSVTCADFDFDGKRQPPTARFSLLVPNNHATLADIRRIAHEYAMVADVAEALQAEKRAAYAQRFGEPT